MKTLFTSLALTIVLTINAQTYQQQQAKLAAYNILFNGIGSGIGAGINKHDNQTFWQAFGQGFYKGCIGGAISYTGKRMNYLIVKEENLWYGWPAKIVHSFGSSMSENAGYNKRMLETISLEFGPARFEYGIYNKKFRTKFIPTSILSTSMFIVKYNAKIDFKNSFKLGNILTYSNIKIESVHGLANGLTRGSSIWYNNNNTNKLKTIAHENIHVFQHEQTNSLISYYPSLKKIQIINKYIYLENWPMQISFYVLEEINQTSKYQNIFELEAYSISNHESY